MDSRRTDALRGEIERLRSDLATSLTRLGDTVSESTDWRRHVRRRPWTFVGGALLVGLVLGGR
ncbi:MAG: hypothetical protein RL199_2125 [Pseudomonadota bacterium]|jgi:ElaB/YqjD/DUF883 family membrane-anchored ribosome-binding protein